MSINIRFKRGLKSNLPLSAPSGTPLWCEDTKELFIGTKFAVKKIGETVQDVRNLNSNGVIYLTDNSIHKIVVTNTVSFVVPSININDGKYHQMLVLLDMPTAKTINLGTSYFLNKETPDMSELGRYNIIYEFDGNYWNVGVLKKGTV